MIVLSPPPAAENVKGRVTFAAREAKWEEESEKQGDNGRLRDGEDGRMICGGSKESEEEEEE